MSVAEWGFWRLRGAPLWLVLVGAAGCQGSPLDPFVPDGAVVEEPDGAVVVPDAGAQAPSIDSFVAAPSSILVNEQSMLSWSTRNATSVSISGLGAVALSGSASVTPTQTTTYTLTATGSGGTATATASVVVQPPQGNQQSWVQVALTGSGLPTGPATVFSAPDGYTYFGTQRTIVRTPTVSPGSSWTSESNGLPTTVAVGRLGMLSNGTLIGVFSDSSGPYLGDIYYWNGSTWVFSVHTGATSFIYEFTQDAAGVTWFATAWNADMWSNGSPGSTTFTKVYPGVYAHWEDGTGGTYGTPSAAGGIYAFQILDLGAGARFVSCGEGDLNVSAPDFSSNVNFLAPATSRGNCVAIEKSADYLIVLRADAAGNGDFINRYGLNSANPGYHQFTTVSAVSGGYPAYPNSNVVGNLKFIRGKRWEWQVQANQTPAHVILRSSDDGATWQDDSAGLSAACAAAISNNIEVGPTGRLFLRCSPTGGSQYWYYDP